MRFEVQIQTESNVISKEVRRIMLSYIKKSLTEASDGKYYDDFFGQDSLKEYSFAIKFPKAKFEKDKIIIEKNNFSVIFSSGNKLLGYVLFSALFAQKNKDFKMPFGNSMKISKIFIKPENEIKNNEVLFNTLSPLVIRKHKKEDNSDKYYSIGDDDFEKIALEIIGVQLSKAGFSKQLIEQLEFKPVNLKKVIVQHYGVKFATSLGQFILVGDKALLNYLYKNGIGSRSSAGFGLAEVLIQ